LDGGRWGEKFDDVALQGVQGGKFAMSAPQDAIEVVFDLFYQLSREGSFPNTG
jgi:hypothetical protein